MNIKYDVWWDGRVYQEHYDGGQPKRRFVEPSDLVKAIWLKDRQIAQRDELIIKLSKQVNLLAGLNAELRRA